MTPRRSPHAGAPITGNPSWIRGDIRPAGLFLNEVQGFMSEDDKAAVRARVLEAIAAYRDGGCVLPPPPSTELVQEMMSRLVCEPVPDEYVPMMFEELDLDGSDPRRVDWSGVDPDARAELPVVMVGAGRNGERLADRWGEAPAAHLGITVPGFPNLFCMYGPGTNLASGGSLVFHSECQMRYIEGCLDYWAWTAAPDPDDFR